MKNIDYVIKKVSIDRGIDETVVRKVITHYWKEAYRKADLMESPALFVKHIGTFYMPYHFIRKLIQHYIQLYRKIPTENYLKYLQKLIKIRPVLSKHYFKRWE